MKQEVKAEPNHLGRPSCSNAGLVSIAITLNPMAAQVRVVVMVTTSVGDESLSLRENLLSLNKSH